VKIFEHAAARTGLRDHEAAAAGFHPVTVQSEADDHKAYYPGSHRITMRFTGDRSTGRLLGAQLFGHKHAGRRQVCRGVPVPPVHAPPYSGVYFWDARNVLTNCCSRGSAGEVRRSWNPHEVATIGAGSPG
jgi:Pyridine nucleotide-disulphide oxidoreductase, dimerisation domain